MKQNIAFVLVMFVMTLGCYPQHVSPDKPSPLPKDAIIKLSGTIAFPRREDPEMPPHFLYKLKNQSDWSITSLEILLHSKKDNASKAFIGKPFNEGRFIDAVQPKAECVFVFSLPLTPDWVKKLNPESSSAAEAVFEDVIWEIKGASGFKKE